MFVLEKGVAPFCQTPLEQSSAEKFGLGLVSGMVDLEGEAEAEDLGSDGRASAEVGRPKSARGRGGSKKRSSKKVEAAAALVAHSLENQANMRPANRMESQFGPW